MLHGDFAGTIETEAFPAGFLNFGRRPVDELMHGIEAAGEVQSAMSVRDQNAGFHGIVLDSDDPDRDLGTGFVGAEYFVRYERLLLHDPERPVKGSRPLFAAHKY